MSNILQELVGKTVQENKGDIIIDLDENPMFWEEESETSTVWEDVLNSITIPSDETSEEEEGVIII